VEKKTAYKKKENLNKNQKPKIKRPKPKRNCLPPIAKT
jgi:hypothetical protein